MAIKKQKNADIPPYSGWAPRTMRQRSRGGSDPNREAKRSLLGSKHDKAIYCSAHGYRNQPNDYIRICGRVDSLKGNQRGTA